MPFSLYTRSLTAGRSAQHPMVRVGVDVVGAQPAGIVRIAHRDKDPAPVPTTIRPTDRRQVLCTPESEAACSARRSENVAIEDLSAAALGGLGPMRLTRRHLRLPIPWLGPRVGVFEKVILLTKTSFEPAVTVNHRIPPVSGIFTHRYGVNVAARPPIATSSVPDNRTP